MWRTEKNNRKAHREHSESAEKYAPGTYGGGNRMWKGTGKGNYNNALKTYLKAKDNASGNAGEKTDNGAKFTGNE